MGCIQQAVVERTVCMSKELWVEVDSYSNETLLGEDPVLCDALEANAKAGLPQIDVAPNQGKLLQILAQMCGARRILEIGTLGGYSTIWLARAVAPGGRVVTLELNPAHAVVAESNIARAGLSDVVEIRVGPALESLQQLETEGAEPFDFIFIDADKPNNPNYLQWALKFSHPGTVIVGDNVIRDGEVADASSADPNVL